MIDDAITVRRAESPADYRALQEVQRLSWGLTETSYLVPIATMVGANLHGGLVLGAYREDGGAVGMSFAFLGKTGGRLCLYSQLTGVLPDYQDRGIGTRLKLAQRDFALSHGLELIAWAFDPLQAGNARFNLHKLGATARRYVPDMYGPRTDALNLAMPTDRLIAEWEVSPRPRTSPDRSELSRLPRLIDAHRPAFRGLVDGGRLLIEIPASLGKLRRDDPSKAQAWQLAVREAFIAAFAQDYVAVDFVLPDESGPEAYLLERP
jgi:predicted GNAT superfamily acetyltransferase